MRRPGDGLCGLYLLQRAPSLAGCVERVRASVMVAAMPSGIRGGQRGTEEDKCRSSFHGPSRR